MNYALVIASRELRERSRLFLLAGALATMPFLSLLLPAARNDRTMVLVLVGTFLAVTIAWSTAAILGASTIGRELTERRLSFYFARPLSPLAIWAGKASASIVVSLLCATIVAAPAFLVARKWFTTVIDAGRAIGVMMLIAVTLFFLSHAIGTMLRSRSALIGLDFLFGGFSAAALYVILRPVVLSGVSEVAAVVLAPIGIALLLVLAIAPVWQLAQGRTDIRRSHAALSRALWIGVAIVLLLSAAGVAWLSSASPADLDGAYLEQSPNGPWVMITGQDNARAKYISTFIVNTATGSREKLDSPTWWGGIRFSGDGRVAAWMQPTSILQKGSIELYTRQLEDGAKSVATGIRVQPPVSFVLSDDGARVAIADRYLLSVFELPSGRLVASARGITGLEGRSMFFVTPNVVRFFEFGRHRNAAAPLRIFELDTTTRKMTQTGQMTIRNMESWSAVSLSGDGSRMLVRPTGDIVDGRTAAPIAKLATATPVMGSAMLRDGRIVAAARENGAVRFRVYSPDAQLLHDLAIPGVKVAWVTGQLDADKVVLTGYVQANPEGTARHRRMIVVDVAKGRIERSMDNVLGPSTPFTTEPRLKELGGDHPFAAIDENGKLLLWDARTGEKKPFRG